MTKPLDLVAGRRIAKNTLWNLAGQVAPLAAAVVSIPLLIEGLTPEGFGLLSLAWMIVGYFSLFDLGLGRALTQVVSDRLGAGNVEEVPRLVATAVVIMLGVGVIGSGVALAITPWAVDSALRIPPATQVEARRAFYLMALSVPAVTITAAFRGLLEANQRFGIVNAIKAPFGVFNFAGPALTLLFSRRVDVVVAVLAASRFAGALAHWIACRLAIPTQTSLRQVDWALAPLLFRFGGWMTVSNVVSPLMVYFDRFLIGSLISMSAVAYYVTPYEIVTKLWAVPAALVAVLFPAFSAVLATDREHGGRLFSRGLRFLFLVMFPVTLGIVVLAPWGLRIWVGATFEARSTRVLQLLAAGVFVNSLAYVPFAYVQGAGRPDLTAKLHFAELPIYAALLWWAVKSFGVQGAAAAWAIRMIIDAIGLLVIGGYLGVRRALVRHALLAIAVALALMFVGGGLAGSSAGIVFLAGTYALFLPVSWRFLLDDDERAALVRAIGPLLSRGRS